MQISDEELNALSHETIGVAIEVHRVLGPGLLEVPYKVCLTYELQKRGLRTAPLRVSAPQSL